MVGGKLSVGGHPRGGAFGVVIAQAGRVGDALRGGAGVVAQIAQDGGAGFGEGVVFRRAVEQHPGAGGGDEPQGVFGFVHVAAGDVQHAICLAARAFEDEHGVRCSGETVGPGHLGEEVLGAHLADVVDQDDGHAAGVGDAFDAGDGGVVGVVGGQTGWGGAADAGQHVDDDEPGVGVLVQPGGDPGVAAVGQRRPGGGDGQPGRGRGGAEQFGHAGLEPPWGVFQGEVEHVSVFGGDRVERLPGAGDGQGEPEGQPGLADLGRPGEQGDAFGEQPRNRPPRRRELGGHELVGGPEVRPLTRAGRSVGARWIVAGC